MTTLLVFIPSLLYDEKSGYLRGVVHNFPNKKIKTVIIYDKLTETAENGNVKYSIWENQDTVGYYFRNSNFYFIPRKTNWISVCFKYGEFYIKEALSDSSPVPSEDCRLLVYDKSEFLKSELLMKQLNFGEYASDCFKTLAHSLHTFSSNSVYNSHSFFFVIFKPFIIFLLKIFDFLFRYSTLAKPILRFSTLGLHLHYFLKNIAWVLSSILNDKKLSLKTGNFLFAFLADIIGGIIFLYFIVNAVTAEDVINFICDTSEGIVLSLRQIIEWLMGSPAGLKLNYPLNSVLGKFFIYHIDLWWSFLGLVRPFLEYGFHIFSVIGKLGLSFQIAIFADFLAVASFHVYCIYVYAARLYNLQLRGLGSLSRLFIGCKRNPIPGKVDSCPYSTEQLFLGTIAFTVLLFLLPTTLVYYIVFAAMRLAVISIGGILTRTRFLLQSLPFCLITFWIFNPVVTSSSIQIVPKSASGSCILFVKPICGGLWDTIKACIPDPVEKPVSVKWGPLIRNVASGSLIYPV